MRTSMVIAGFLFGVWVAANTAAASQVASDVVTPEEFFGFRPGSDRKLVDYDQLTAYLELAGAGSERVSVRTLGTSALGRTMQVVFVSSPANIDQLDRLIEINRRLALDPDIPGPELDRLVDEGRVFVLSLHSMHSSEVGPAQSVPLVVHELATTERPEQLTILDEVVLVIVPSHNPDGMDMVVEHYRSTVGTEYEGSSLPGLYHRYVGHDNNRDYVSLTQPESRAVNRLFSTELFPQVLLDKHQMGRTGPRYFVPEYHDPIAINIDEDLWYWSDVFGSAMAKDLGAAGLSGVASHWVFDEYWPGAATTSHWKGVISLLTEAASCRLATPVYVEPTELSVRGKGLAEYKKGVNMPDPWPGGWWRLGDIVRYERVTMRSALATSAKHRRELLRFRHQLTRNEVAGGRDRAPYYYVVPAAQPDPGAVVELAELLQEHGVTVYRLTTRIEAAGRTFEAGDLVIPLAQPYRAFIKEVMEVQRYPIRRYTPEGEIIRPYDITSWSLPLNLGLESYELDERSEPLEERFEAMARDDGETAVRFIPDGSWGVVLSAAEDAGYRAAFAALRQGLMVARIAKSREIDGQRMPPGSFVISGGSDELAELTARVAGRAAVLAEPPSGPIVPVRAPRIALVETHFHHMDAGWTRFVFDEYGIPFTVLRPEDVDSSDLPARFDVLVFPDTDPETLTKGLQKWGDEYVPSDMAPEYRRPISGEGMERLRTFIDTGGIVVSWGRSTTFILEDLNDPESDAEFYLPARDLSGDLEKRGLYVPGSMLTVELTEDHPLAWGLPRRAAVFSTGQPVLATSIPIRDTDRRVVAAFPERDILVSGYAEHEELLSRRAALVWLQKGEGQVVLFGFRPQFRAQTRSTFKLLFNALLLGDVPVTAEE